MNALQHIGITLAVNAWYTLHFSADTLSAIVRTFYAGMWG